MGGVDAPGVPWLCDSVPVQGGAIYGAFGRANMYI